MLQCFFFQSPDEKLFGQQQVLVRKHVRFQLLHLLLVQFLTLRLDDLTLVVSHLELSGITRLNYDSLQEDLLLTDLDFRRVKLDSVDLRLCETLDRLVIP